MWHCLKHWHVSALQLSAHHLDAWFHRRLVCFHSFIILFGYRIASFMLQLLNGLTSMKRSMVFIWCVCVFFAFVVVCAFKTNNTKNENISLTNPLPRIVSRHYGFLGNYLAMWICEYVCMFLCTHRHRLWHSNQLPLFISIGMVCAVLPKEVAIILPNFWGHCFLARVLFCAKSLCCLMNAELCQRLSCTNPRWKRSNYKVISFSAGIFWINSSTNWQCLSAAFWQSNRTIRHSHLMNLLKIMIE